jgi:hypothetical protein
VFTILFSSPGSRDIDILSLPSPPLSFPRLAPCSILLSPTLLIRSFFKIESRQCPLPIHNHVDPLIHIEYCISRLYFTSLLTSIVTIIPETMASGTVARSAVLGHMVWSHAEIEAALVSEGN